jgi:competence protein ComEA
VRLACSPESLGQADGRVGCGLVGSLSQGQRRVIGLPLELNRATAEELDALPGIGPKLAARIVEDRSARGPFPSVAALERVSGIGPGKLRSLAGQVTVLSER